MPTDIKFETEDAAFIGFTSGLGYFFFTQTFRETLKVLEGITTFPLVSAYFKYISNLWWILSILSFSMSLIRFWVIFSRKNEHKYYSLDILFLYFYVFLLIFFLPISAIYTWFTFAIIGFPDIFEYPFGVISYLFLIIFFTYWMILSGILAYYMKKVEIIIFNNVEFFKLYINGYVTRLVSLTAKYVLSSFIGLILFILLIIANENFICGVITLYILGPLFIVDMVKYNFGISKYIKYVFNVIIDFIVK